MLLRGILFLKQVGKKEGKKNRKLMDTNRKQNMRTGGKSLVCRTRCRNLILKYLINKYLYHITAELSILIGYKVLINSL